MVSGRPLTRLVRRARRSQQQPLVARTQGLAFPGEAHLAEGYLAGAHSQLRPSLSGLEFSRQSSTKASDERLPASWRCSAAPFQPRFAARAPFFRPKAEAAMPSEAHQMGIPHLSMGNPLTLSRDALMSPWATQSHLMATSAAGSEASALRDIRREDLVVQLSPFPKAPSADLSSLRFGAQFSEHMLKVQWTRAHGWGAPRITPLEPIPMHPAAQVLHYGMSCFEGMKAYKGEDGRVRLFRPGKNMDRMFLSCLRLNLPTFDKEAFLECIKELLRVDEAWVPQRDGYSMYLRPFALATTPFLGVGPPAEVLLCCILSPAGPYFPEGLKPIGLFVDTQHVRACPGGVGDRKVAGNYAPTILPQVEAAKKGCSQVLYVLKDFGGVQTTAPVDAMEEDEEEEDGWVGESGAMNVFFLMRNKKGSGAAGATSGTSGLELVTPPLDGLILPGVTRDSVLELVKGWGEGIQVSERPIRLKELKEAHKEGRLVEVFGTGTAVIVQPVNYLTLSSGKKLDIPVDEAACSYWTGLEPGKAHQKPVPGAPFSLTGRIYRALLDIQYGHVEHPWSVVI